MKHKALKQGYDGEWIRPVRRGYLMGCCDCGLVHRFNFRINDGAIEYQAFRSPRYTAGLRKKQIKVKK